MNKIRFLYIIILVLVATNVFLLLNQTSHKPHHPKHPKEPKYVIIEKLGFDQQQCLAYEKIIQKHRNNIELTEQKIRSNKDALFTLLKSENSSKKDSILTNLGSLQMEIEQIHFAHFEEIRAICKSNQIERFNDLTGELGKLFAPNKGHHKPGRK